MLTASAAIAVLSLMLPLALLQVYDRIIPNNSTETAAILGLAVASAIFVEMLLRVARSNLLADAGESFEQRTGRFLFSRILGADPVALRRTGTGEHLDRFNAISSVRDFAAGQPMVLIFDTLFAALFLGFIAWIGGVLVLWPIFCIAVAVIVTLCCTPRLKRHLAQQLAGDSKVNDFLMSTLDAAHTVRALGMETSIVERHRALQVARSVCHMRVERLTTHLGDFTGLMTNASTVLIVCHGALLVNASALTTGGLAACTILAGRAMQPLRSGLGMWSRFLSVRAAQRKMNELAALEQKDEKATDASAPESRGEIRFVGVSCAGRDTDSLVLPPTDLRIEPGEVICLIGPNSSGKSVLMQLMAGDRAPTTGSVLLDGRNATSLTGLERRQTVAVLSEHDTLFKGSIVDNITGFRPDLRDSAIDAARFLGFAAEIDLLPRGFDTPVTEVSNSFSRGFVQRVCLARALMDRPAVLLADQAFSALDHSGRRHVERLINKLRGHTTVVIVTYEPDLLPVADRVFDLWDGELRTKTEVNNDPLERKSA